MLILGFEQIDESLNKLRKVLKHVNKPAEFSHAPLNVWALKLVVQVLWKFKAFLSTSLRPTLSL